jgi:hypothetical protein
LRFVAKIKLYRGLLGSYMETVVPDPVEPELKRLTQAGNAGELDRETDMYIVNSSIVKVIGTGGSAMADSIRNFLTLNDVRFQWVELRSDEDARREIGMERLDESRLPVVIFRYGDRVERPSIATMITFLQDGGSSEWP